MGVLGLLLILATGCRSFNPVPLASVSFKDRAMIRSDDQLTVSVVALNREESASVFGADVWSRDVQPVWIEVENRSDDAYWFVPSLTDPDYFSPAEAAYMKRFRWSRSKNNRMRAHFESLEFPALVPPNSNVSGFLHTASDPGLKFVNVSLLSLEGLRDYRFVAPVPGLRADYQDVELDSIYSSEEWIHCDEPQLAAALGQLVATATNRKGNREADPLNIVLIGNDEVIVSALVKAGWDVTEKMSFGSIARTIRSSLFGKRYRNSPVSSLYVFGRNQEAAFQRARTTVDQRNHLRLWLTPLRLHGDPVWIGQISRDIGVKLTLKTGFLTTHVIDPDVDDDRSFLLQTLVNTRSVRRFGYVSGVGSTPADEPRYNLGGDPYYTDGLRVVVECSMNPVDISDIEVFHWQWPPETEPHVDALITSE